MSMKGEHHNQQIRPDTEAYLGLSSLRATGPGGLPLVLRLKKG